MIALPALMQNRSTLFPEFGVVGLVLREIRCAKITAPLRELDYAPTR
jgi:hypothetical protein